MTVSLLIKWQYIFASVHLLTNPYWVKLDLKVKETCEEKREEALGIEIIRKLDFCSDITVMLHGLYLALCRDHSIKNRMGYPPFTERLYWDRGLCII